MSKEKQLEELVRVSPVGGHVDQRRSILDAPFGYLHGMTIGVVNVIALNRTQPIYVLGNHFHPYSEGFIVQGKGDLYVRAVAPGEVNRIKPELVIPEGFVPDAALASLVGTQIKIPVDSSDKSKTFVRVLPGMAHTFALEQGSTLVACISGVTQGFNPGDKKNFSEFPLYI